jgi:Dolichyl-phosphate-mannose-protein mannosyltransferase
MLKHTSDRKILVFLFVAALWIRLAGLSHDLHLDALYHPDTAKQMRAIEEFLNGQYLVIKGHSDYDGYPLFNSHMVEYIIRAAMAVETAWLKHTGAWTGPVDPPSFISLFWITRTWNAFLSALAVPLIFVIGRKFNRGVAWLAGGLLLVSPLDVNACHFASNDSAVALFALLCLFFGFRIYEQGRRRDLIGGALCIAAAFSSKYHGAMAFLPVLIGHILFCRRTGGLFTVAALQRWLILAVFGIAGIFLTSPAFLINVETAAGNIVHFARYTANFALSAEIKAMPFYRRLWLGWQENIPTLVYTISLPVALGFLAAIVAWRKDARLGMLVTVPIFHLFVGLAGKPHLHQSHHIPTTGYMILAGSVIIIGMMKSTSIVVIKRLIAGVAMVWSFSHLAHASYREIFFFSRNDTRRVAETWMRASVPPGVKWMTSRYTFIPPASENKFPVHVIAQSDDHPTILPGFDEWARFSHDDRSLSRFVNREILIHLVSNPVASAGMRLPYCSPYPDDRGDNMVSLDVPWYGLSSLVRDVDARHPVDVIAVSTQSLSRVWLVVRTGATPASMDIRFGKFHEQFYLKPGEVRVFAVDQPEALIFPLDEQRHFYHWTAEARWGEARLMLFTDAGQYGMWLYQRGEYASASKILSADNRTNVFFQTIKELSAPEELSQRGAMKAQLEKLLVSPDDWFQTFGVSEDWINHIPCQKWTNEDWESSTSETQTWVLNSVLLEAGHYRVSIAAEHTANVEIRDSENRTIHSVDVKPGDPFPLNITRMADPISIYVKGASKAPAYTMIRPDARAHVEALIGQLSQPTKADVISSVLPVSGKPVVAEFSRGIALTDFKLDASNFRSGGHLGVQLEWLLPVKLKHPGQYAVWVHVVDGEGKLVAQLDKGIWHYARKYFPDMRNPVSWDQISIPEQLPPGPFEVRLGVWIPDQRTRLQVERGSLMFNKRYAILKTIRDN